MPTDIKGVFESKFRQEEKLYASAFGVNAAASSEPVGMGSYVSIGIVGVAAMILVAL